MCVCVCCMAFIAIIIYSFVPIQLSAITPESFLL